MQAVDQLLERLPLATFPSLVAGALLAVWLARGFRRMWRLGRRANQFFDQVMGQPARDGRPEQPSLMQRMATLEAETAALTEQMADHLKWHGQPGSRPAAPLLSKPNGEPSGRRSPRT